MVPRTGKERNIPGQSPKFLLWFLEAYLVVLRVDPWLFAQAFLPVALRADFWVCA